jgi:hypothetical protein
MIDRMIAPAAQMVSLYRPKDSDSRRPLAFQPHSLRAIALAIKENIWAMPIAAAAMDFPSTATPIAAFAVTAHGGRAALRYVFHDAPPCVAMLV